MQTSREEVLARWPAWAPFLSMEVSCHGWWYLVLPSHTLQDLGFMVIQRLLLLREILLQLETLTNIWFTGGRTTGDSSSSSSTSTSPPSCSSGQCRGELFVVPQFIFSIFCYLSCLILSVLPLTNSLPVRGTVAALLAPFLAAAQE